MSGKTAADTVKVAAEATPADAPAEKPDETKQTDATEKPATTRTSRYVSRQEFEEWKTQQQSTAQTQKQSGSTVERRPKVTVVEVQQELKEVPPPAKNQSGDGDASTSAVSTAQESSAAATATKPLPHGVVGAHPLSLFTRVKSK